MPTKIYYSVDGDLIGEATGGVATTYMSDALGSTVGTITNAGVQNRYVYKPYGGQLARTGSATDPKFLWNGRSQLRVTGRSYSGEYAPYRHYSAESAVWSGLDRLWPLQLPYSYVASNPTTRGDRSGLCIHCVYAIDDFFSWGPICFPCATVRSGAPPYNPPTGGHGGPILFGPPDEGGGQPGDPISTPKKPIINRSKCPVAMLKLAACLAGATIDIGLDYVFQWSPWKPPSLSPEPPPPIPVDPNPGCIPPDQRNAINKGRYIGTWVGYGGAKYAECFLQFDRDCNDPSTEPWQMCSYAPDCELCCDNYFSTHTAGIAYEQCRQGCNTAGAGQGFR